MDRLDQREQMVEALREKRGIHEPRLLEAFRTIPRHRFVPEELAARAYDDSALAIGFAQTISQPYMIALMLRALRLVGHEKVLEIGTGSGYGAALLGHLAARVHSLEIIPELTERARRVLSALGITNVTLHQRDGSAGFPEEAPFDAIIVTAAAPVIPKLLTDQLAEGGRLVIPVGAPKRCRLHLVERLDGECRTTPLGECSFVPLTGVFGMPGEG